MSTLDKLIAVVWAGLAKVATTGSYTDLINTPTIPPQYTLPVATSSVLGGVKQGSNITIGGDGTISATATYTLPTASATTLGGVMVGSGLAINSGVLSLNYTSPVISVSGQTGAVVVKAQSASPQTGTFSVVANSGATTGTITTHDLVAGSGVTIAPDGNSNLVISSAGLVSSVSGQTGAVTVQALDNNTSTGISIIANSGSTTGTIKLLRLVAGANITMGADGSGNLQITGATPTPPYVLPAATASVLGGVKQGTGVTIAADGTISVPANGVNSVNGQTGAVTISVVDANPASGSTLISDTGSTTGTAKLLRIVAGTNIALANDVNGNLQISSTGSLPIASGSTLGGVKIGSNVSIAGDGTISVAAPYTLPVATASTLGGVKQGSGVTIAGDGTISVSAGSVSSVSGQTGAVVVQATNNNAATGTTLISDGGATTGNIKLKTLVAGTSVTLTADGNNNLVINSTNLAPILYSFSSANNIGSGFNGLATVVLSGATGNTTIGIAAGAVSGSTAGARVIFMNATSYIMTITTPGNNLQLRGAAAVSSIALNAGAQLEFVFMGTGTSIFLATPTAFSG
jgi:hypothetical protein